MQLTTYGKKNKEEDENEDLRKAWISSQKELKRDATNELDNLDSQYEGTTYHKREGSNLSELEKEFLLDQQDSSVDIPSDD